MKVLSFPQFFKFLNIYLKILGDNKDLKSLLKKTRPDCVIYRFSQGHLFVNTKRGKTFKY